MTHCSICGRELTDPVSVSRGIGPECILGAKQDLVGQGTLFASRAAYDYKIRNGVLMLYDLNGGRSLTSDMELVLKEIEETEGDLSYHKIMYKDCFGEWDGVVYRNGRVRLFHLGGTDQQQALNILEKKWNSASTMQS